KLPSCCGRAGRSTSARTAATPFASSRACYPPGGDTRPVPRAPAGDDLRLPSNPGGDLPRLHRDVPGDGLLDLPPRRLRALPAPSRGPGGRAPGNAACAALLVGGRGRALLPPAAGVPLPLPAGRGPGLPAGHGGARVRLLARPGRDRHV